MVHAGRRTGFTLIELLVVIAVIAVLIGILLPVVGRARKTGRLALCESNMRQVGAGLHAYAADFKQATSAFTWKARGTYSQDADLNNATSDFNAHQRQAVGIARRKTLRGAYYGPNLGRFVARNFTHLPMMDMGYLGELLNSNVTVCPDDRNALVWHRNFDDIFRGLAETGDPDPNANQDFKKLLPFWASYQFVSASWTFEGDPNALTQANGGPGLHLLFTSNPNTRLGNRSLADVIFPAQKVWTFDLFDRHNYKRPIWYAYPVATQPLLFFDGSVTIRKTMDANPGWNPRYPTQTTPIQYSYYPTAAEPRTLSGAASETVTGMFRWTRAGLKGVDFGGREQVRW